MEADMRKLFVVLAWILFFLGAAAMIGPQVFGAELFAYQTLIGLLAVIVAVIIGASSEGHGVRRRVR